jgi:hypothetical protein
MMMSKLEIDMLEQSRYENGIPPLDQHEETGSVSK